MTKLCAKPWSSEEDGLLFNEQPNPPFGQCHTSTTLSKKLSSIVIHQEDKFSKRRKSET